MALSLAYLVSGILIIAAAIGDLWLDEIGSIQFVRAAHRPTEILTRFHHDNNHVLNTLFLWLVGAQKTFFVYRLLAIVSGMASLLLVAYLARTWGALEAWLAVVLTGTSYPLVLYFSEARGYAPAIMFALLSYALLRGNWNVFNSYRMIAFWVTSVLGILSHLSFVMVSLALLFANLAHEVRTGILHGRKLICLLAYHTVPFVFLGLAYIFFVRDMAIGGGPVYTIWSVITQLSTLLLGLPQNLFFGALAVVLLLSLILAGSYTLFRNQDEEWLFFCSVLIAAPMLMLIFARPQYLYFRYFIVCVPFFYLLLSYLLGRGYQHSKLIRTGVIAAMALLLTGQMARMVSLLEFGRGNYRAALARILENSPADIVRIGSDHDFRNRMLVDFYAPSMRGPRTVRYIPQSDWHREPPDWILTHNQEISYDPPVDITVPGIGVYHLFAVYRFSGVSGWNWLLYRSNY